MKVAIVGAELEENLGIRYMASSLESKGHTVEIVPFNSECDIQDVVRKVISHLSPDCRSLHGLHRQRQRVLQSGRGFARWGLPRPPYGGRAIRLFQL